VRGKANKKVLAIDLLDTLAGESGGVIPSESQMEEMGSMPARSASWRIPRLRRVGRNSVRAKSLMEPAWEEV
jgi:hypothetical protein